MSPAWMRGRWRIGRDAQLRPNAGRQLAQLKGLGQVVDGAGVEAGDPMLELSARRENDHGQPLLGDMQLRQHREAAAAGQHHVEYDEVDGLAQRLLDPGHPVGRRVHVEPVRAQATLEEVDDPRLILDHQDQAARGRAHRAIIGPWGASARGAEEVSHRHIGPIKRFLIAR